MVRDQESYSMSFKKVSNPAAGKSRHPAFNPSLFLPVLVILIVSCSVYINALPNGFVCDDNLQILENPWIQDIKHIPDIFSKSIWSFRKESLTSNYYRPLTHLIYLATYHIFGTQPWGFHLVNILFHAAVSVLVFMIAARLNDIFHLPASRRFLSAPFVAAIFFAVHPVHTEAVTYVSCLPELSFTLFYLLSFYFHIRFREGYGKGYLFSILFFFASALCKEPGITLPLVLAAYDYTVGNTRGRSYTHLKKYIPYLLAGGLYFALRFNALGGLAPLTENSKLSTYQNIINVFPLFTQYLEMLVFPLNLNAFHVFHPITSLTEPRGILSLAVAAAFVGLIYMALKRNRVAALCLLLIVIPLLPVFYIRGIQGGAVFYERYLYLPSFGFVILLALLMERVKEKSIRGNSIAAISFIVLAGLYAAGTVSRNFDWKDELSLFTDTARKSPDGDIPHYDLGYAYLRLGRIDEAISEYQTAIKLNPDFFGAHYDLGYAYLRLGRIDEAISEYQTAIKLNPDSADAHYHLGKAYAYQSLFDQAISEYKTALKIDPDHAPSQKSLAIIGNMKQ
jgi:protein O-mannosyl-transferase